MNIEQEILKVAKNKEDAEACIAAYQIIGQIMSDAVSETLKGGYHSREFNLAGGHLKIKVFTGANKHG